MTVFEEIHRQFQSKGSEPALSFGGIGPDTISYRRLGHQIDVVAARLHRMGVIPGQIYGVAIEAPLMHIVMLFALERLGAANASVERLDQMNALTLAAVFTARDIPSPDCRVVRVGKDWFLPDSDVVPPPLRVHEPDDIMRVSFTSGSTGEPLPVALTYRVLAERYRNQDASRGEAFNRAGRRLCCMGINTSFAFQLMTRTLSGGGLFCFRDDDIPRTVRRIAMYEVQAIIGSPLQLVAFADYGRRHPNSFRSVELIFSLGSRIPPALADELRGSVCPNLLVSYGSSEAGVTASGMADTLDLVRGDVGHVLPGIDLEILDEVSGKPVYGTAGRVRIRGKGGVQGYFLKAGRKATNFEDGWFYPGDLGILRADGLLAIVGRTDNVVNLGGVKTTYDAIDAELRAGPGVKEVAVVGVPGLDGVMRFTVFVVPEDGWSEPEFVRHCSSALRAQPAKIVSMPALPRGPSGKVDRLGLRSMA